jgi:AraC-like DNA-binding protein
MRQLNTYTDDPVSEVLARMRVHSTVYCLAELHSPWGFRVEGRHVAKFHLLLEGQAWLALDDFEPLLLSAGDLVILPHGHKHTMKDEPDSPVEALDRILLDHPLDARAMLYYGGPGALSRMLCGGFGLNDPVRSLLPGVMRIDAKADRVESWTDTTLRFLREEAAQSLPGAKAVFAKIADVFLTQAIREFLTSPSEAMMTTATALTDPHIAQAVQLLQAEPGRAWSVGQLAHQVGMSRSAFNDRFRNLVGEPPMRYLTLARLTQAAHYLATSDRTLDDIARRCGYESGAALSKAFKREHGQTPGAYRAAASRQPVIDVSA